MSHCLGVLRLLKSEQESVIVACTMTSRAEATLFEMDLHSNFLLAPIKDLVFCRSPIYLKTLSYCDDEAAEWQRQIKVGIRYVQNYFRYTDKYSL